MTTLNVLDREMYSEAEAARLLRVPQSTLNYWLEGGCGSKTYDPIIRVEKKGARSPVTWAEFVEAGLLRSYRRDQRQVLAWTYDGATTTEIAQACESALTPCAPIFTTPATHYRPTGTSSG